MDKKWIKLNPYNNPFEDKINKIEKNLDEAVRLMAKEDSKTFNLFPGWKWFKLKDK